MVTADQALLKDAIARNAGALLSLPSAGMFRNHRTRFLACDEGGFWIEMPVGEKPLVDALVASCGAVGLSIKAGANTAVVTTTIDRCDPGMRINAQTVVDALLMAWPREFKTVQRRADYRARITTGSAITGRVWRIPERQPLTVRPPATAEVRCAVRDLSIGGTCLIVTPRPDEPRLAVDQRLRIQLTWDGGEALIEGRARHGRPLPGGEVRHGVQFRKMDNSIEGRQALAALTAVVGQLQRDELRRMRLGLAG
jgi:hypothetical protein